MFQDLVQLSLTIFVFFKLTGLEAIEDHCEPETLHSGCRAAFAESVFFFSPPPVSRTADIHLFLSETTSAETGHFSQ